MPNLAVEPQSGKDQEQELGAMSLLQHLEELRKRVIFSVIAIAVCFGACWKFAGRIYQVVQQPIQKALENHHLDTHLVYLNPTEPFNLYLKIGLIAGIFVASPILLYQVWMFISPGLYRREKKFVLPFLFLSVALFVSGGMFGFKIVYPVALDFLIGYGGDFKPMITIGEYTDLFLTIMLGMGVIFEMPILVFFLSMMGIVSPRWMWHNVRYSILVIFIIAAILKIENSRVFQQAANHAANHNIVANARHSRPQGTHAADREINRDACLRGHV